MSGLISVGEALARVLEGVGTLEPEDVALREALGRFAAEAAKARSDLPPFESSAMDGYAVRSADTPGQLALVGRSAAGSPATRAVGEREAIAISTGAVVPAGADAVVPVERTAARGETIHVEGVALGENVRPRGGDIGAGEIVVERGTRLGPPQIAALAAAGAPAVSCTRRPLVAVIPTGSELRAPGTRLGPGEIYESNGLLLAAQLETAGATGLVFDPVADDEDVTRAALARGLEADVLVTSGGVSVGEHDLVRGLLAELGVDEVFWGVAVRPGKPIAFGTRGTTLVFGLPGNPVSSLVGFELFVRPALLALQGAAEPRPAYLPGRLGSARRRNSVRDDFVRARTRIEDGAVVLDPLTGQESHMIVRAAAAGALVLVPRGEGELSAGAQVKYLAV